MLLEEYRKFTESMLIEREPINKNSERAAYLALGLVGEAGEVSELIKKMLRDGKLDVRDLQLELGDVFYYFITLADLYGISLGEIMLQNVKKLTQRRERGTLVRR